MPAARMTAIQGHVHFDLELSQPGIIAVTIGTRFGKPPRKADRSRSPRRRSRVVAPVNLREAAEIPPRQKRGREFTTLPSWGKSRRP